MFSRSSIQQFVQVHWLSLTVSVLLLIALVYQVSLYSNHNRQLTDQRQAALSQVVLDWQNTLNLLENNRNLQQFLSVYEQSGLREIRRLQPALEQDFDLLVSAPGSRVAGIALVDIENHYLVFSASNIRIQEGAARSLPFTGTGMQMSAGAQLLSNRPVIRISRQLENSDAGLRLDIFAFPQDIFPLADMAPVPGKLSLQVVADNMQVVIDPDADSRLTVDLGSLSPGNSLQLQVTAAQASPWPVLLLILVLMLSLFRHVQQWRGQASEIVSDVNDLDFRAQFLVSISQELRSPINGMLGMLSLVKDTRLTQEQSRILVSVQRSAEWLSQVINDFLDYSRMDSGSISLELIDFDIRQTVNDVAEMLSVQAYSKGVEIGSLIGSGIPSRINGDPTRLRQILINLVTNAIKFTEKGDVAISVTTDNRKTEGLWLRFDVADTGIGIDSEFKNSLFEPFEQGDESIGRRFGGTGVGLTICRTLVEMMGGEIDAHENSQGGATFWFSLPFAEASQDITPDIENSLAGYKVLVAGEVAINRKTILETLSEWGVLCDQQESVNTLGKTLINAIEADSPYDACIIDVSLNLTNEKAFAVVEKLRKQSLLQQTRIMLLTSDGRPGDGMLARSKGIQGYLTKPINRSQLQSSLQQIFRYDDIQDIPLITRHRLREVEADEQFTILLIDASKKTQQHLTASLQDMSCQVEVSGSLKKALASLQQKPYDMVMVDTRLLTGDDADLIQRIKELEKKGALPASRHERVHDMIPVIGLVSSQKAEVSNSLLDTNRVHGCISKQASVDHLDNVLSLWLHTDTSTEPDSLITN